MHTNQQCRQSASRNDCDNGAPWRQPLFLRIQYVSGRCGFLSLHAGRICPRNQNCKICSVPQGNTRTTRAFPASAAASSAAQPLASTSRKNNDQDAPQPQNQTCFSTSAVFLAAQLRARRSLLEQAGLATVLGCGPGLNSKPPATCQLMENKFWFCLYSK